MIFFHNAHSYTHFSYLYTKYNTSRQMKRIKTAILLAAAAVAITACNRKPVVPEFGMLPIDTLLEPQDNGCNIEYRFATIGNAGKSAALEAIEKANIEYFFELEELAGTARKAADSAILQVAAEIVLPEGMSQGMGAYEISVESEGSCRTRSLLFDLPGGVSLAGRTACTTSNTIPIRSQQINSRWQTCTLPRDCSAWRNCSERNSTPNTGRTTTKGWPNRASSGIHRPDGKFPITPKASPSLTTPTQSDAMHSGPSKWR